MKALRPELCISSYLDLQVGQDEYGPGGCGDGPPDGGRQTREIQDDEDHSAGRRGGQALNERKHCICRPHQSEQRASTLSSDSDPDLQFWKASWIRIMICMEAVDPDPGGKNTKINWPKMASLQKYGNFKI